jgi:excisionase family DNA binding protein
VEPRFLTLTEAADRLGLTVGQVRGRVERGTIPAVRIGRALRVPVRALDELEPAERAEPLRSDGARRRRDPRRTPRPAPPEEVLLTPGQAAALLNVTTRTLGRWCREGQLVPAIRTIGGHRRFREADVERFLECQLRFVVDATAGLRELD